jgi:hypothetical protein
MRHHRAISKPKAMTAVSGLESLLLFLVEFVDQIIGIVFAINGGKIGR